MQNNSFNLTSDNSEMLIIWHMRRAVPRSEVLLSTRKKASSLTEARRPQRVSIHQPM
jgi:hypothetical protein